MDWRDEGVVIGVRRLGETSVILEVMTRGHGRHLGVVRGGRSRRMQPILQAGNGVDVTWRARLDAQLGTFAVEGLELRAASLMARALSLHAVNWLGCLLRLLPERDPHPALYETLHVVLDRLDAADLAPALVVRFEVAILSELGFGLDLARCAATGAREALVYVSPRSGRAVSRDAGAPYRERLLALPAFLTAEGAGADAPTPRAVADGFALTTYFLERDVFVPRGAPMPDSRRALIAEIERRR